MTKQEANIRQIIYMIQFANITPTKEFVFYVYNKKLNAYSIEIIKNLYKEFNK